MREPINLLSKNHLKITIVCRRGEKRHLGRQRYGGERSLETARNLFAHCAARFFQLLDVGRRDRPAFQKTFHELPDDVLAVRRAASVTADQELVPVFVGSGQ